MARKVVNRKELRAENDAAEAKEKAAEVAGEEGADGKKKKAKKPAVKRTSSASWCVGGGLCDGLCRLLHPESRRPG